jgi:STE24 endopeptidase
MKGRRTGALVFVLLLVPAPARLTAQESHAPAGARVEEAGPPALVDNPLGEIPPDDPKMESYSHGNYVLYLVDSLWNAGLLAIIVFSGFGGTLLEWAGKWTRSPNLKVAAYAVLFGLVTFVGGFPLTAYASYVREKTYGFANQTFAAWLGDRGKGLLVALVLQAIFLVILYAAIRRLGRRWWVAGSILAVLFAILVVAIAPVFIAPLFNRFEPLKDASLRADILEMARREGIPAREVYQVDASRQSGHNNAYVAGILGTQRIVLYDTLLKQFTPREIKAVMGHEMGHYVLNHVWKTVAFLALVIVAGFFLVDRVSRRVIERRPELGIAALSEPSSLPLISLVLSVFLFIAGPAIATFSRAQEHQADLFGLAVTRDPVAAASAFLKFGRLDLDEYHVDPFIETLLYSHPSLANRVRTAQDYARRHGVVGRTSGP